MAHENRIIFGHGFDSRLDVLLMSCFFCCSLRVVVCVSQMGSFVDGVEFDTIAREWRCKWEDKEGRPSLAEAQKALNSVLPAIKAIDGVKKVDRIVCGGCMDFKVCEIVERITNVPH